jgi:hypothetical protein
VNVLDSLDKDGAAEDLRSERLIVEWLQRRQTLVTVAEREEKHGEVSHPV